MRNLKRALSLLLSSAMVLGMMVMGSSAASYTDVTSKENVEAIEVLKAVGVMTGDQNGNFNPDKAVTRNEMAVVMANLLNLDYEYYTGAKTSFTDVPEWAAKYVAACQANGIIAGYSNTIFGGSDNVTAAQAALMMMKALGYFKYQGDFENDWQLATVKQASKIDLYDGINVGATTAMTRNEIAQLVLNTLEADMVEFNGTVGTEITTSDGTSVIVGYRAQYDPYASTKGDYTAANGYTRDGYLQLAEELYGRDLRKATGASDEFERPSTTWTYNKNGVVKNIGTFANDATLTYTEAVEIGTIYTDLGLTANKAHARVAFHVDGAVEGGTANDGSTSLATLGLIKGSKVEIGGNGVLTQVYVDDTTNDVTVIMTNTYAGEVTSVRAATSTKDANITVTPLNATRGGNFETEDFKVDDIVYYTYSNKAGDVGVQSVVKAEQITGELTGYTAGKSVVVGGTTYKFNAAAVISTSELAGAINSDVTLTLDQYGYVLDVDVSAASTNYAVVLGYAVSNGIDDPRAKLLFTDGSVKTVNLSAALGTSTEGTVVSYTINNKDQYVLTVLNAGVTQGSDATMVTKGNATMNTAIDSISAVNGKTIFLVATKNGNDTVYTSYTGIANVPTVTLDYTDTAIPVGVYAKSNNVATVVYINASYNNSSVSSSSDNVVFVLGDSSVGASYDSVKGTYYVYDAIVNGEITKIESATQHTAFGMYNTISTDTNGVVTVSNTAGITGNGTTIKGTGKEENGSITLNNTVLSYADDCQVFYIDTDKNISVSSIGGIANDETDKVWYKVVDSEVVAVVIYQVVSNDRTITGATCEFTGANITNVTATYSAPTFSVTVSGRASNGDTIVLKPTVSAGAVANSITLTYNGSSWTPASADVTVTAESGVSTTTAVTITVP